MSYTDSHYDRLASHHKVLLEAMRARENEIVKFLGIMLPAVGGLAYLFAKQREILPEAFIVGIIIVQFLFCWGMNYALVLSYNYRCLQAQIKILESAANIDAAVLKKWQSFWLPAKFRRKVHERYSIDKSWWRQKKERCSRVCIYLAGFTELLPEIFKTQFIAFGVGIILTTTVGVIGYLGYSNIPAPLVVSHDISLRMDFHHLNGTISDRIQQAAPVGRSCFALWSITLVVLGLFGLIIPACHHRCLINKYAILMVKEGVLKNFMRSGKPLHR